MGRVPDKVEVPSYTKCSITVTAPVTMKIRKNWLLIRPGGLRIVLST